jgi:hypothetical protein
VAESRRMGLPHEDHGLKIDLVKADTSAPAPSAPSLPMNALWRTIRGYIWWVYERGSIHYDIMVTIILLFVLLSPLWINFNDKPVERNPHPTGLVVVPDKQGGFIYQIESSAITAKGDAGIQNQLRQIIEPVSGAVSISKYEAVKDGKGHVVSYKVWAQKE